MNLQQTRKSLGLSLREAAKLAGISHEQIRIAERGAAGEVAVEQIRAAYRKHARKSAQLAIPEKDVIALKSLKKSKLKFKPLTLSVTFSADEAGDIRIRYSGTDERTHDVGAAVCEAIAATSGCTANLVEQF